MEAYDKEKLRKRRVEIRHILMSKWDPIGVSDVPEAADEYDSYIGDVYELLNCSATDEKIAKYLRWVETERMGLTDLKGNPLLPAEVRAGAVAALQALRDSWL
jgi:hypothetical protein